MSEIRNVSGTSTLSEVASETLEAAGEDMAHGGEATHSRLRVAFGRYRRASA
jgi:hypothetical protein